MADKIVITSGGAILHLDGATDKIVITSNGLIIRDEAAVVGGLPIPVAMKNYRTRRGGNVS